MSKFFTFLFIFVLLISFSLVGYHVVSANEMINETEDIISKQNRVEEYFSSYGYTIDNPSIILNPYSISPLTALILFETDKEVSVTLTVVGKSPDTTFQNTFNKSKKHYIPVYGLYPDYKNKVIVSYDNISREYVIETEKLPNDIKIDKNISVSDQLTFVNYGTYPYALDKNRDVRWYLNKNYSGKIQRLENSHLLLGKDVLLDKKYPKDIIELDLLGKIYYQYSLEDGYYGSFAEDNSSLFILSKNLLKIDRQSGVVLKQKVLSNSYQRMEIEKDVLKLQGESSLTINLDSFESSVDDTFKIVDELVSYSDLYLLHDEFKLIKGVKFSTLKETKQSNKHFWLVGYKNIDKQYLNYNINFLKEEDYFQVNGSFLEDDEVYVILDQFMDKRIYSMINNQLIINKMGLHGKYSIYIKVNDLLYKTNHYVSF